MKTDEARRYFRSQALRHGWRRAYWQTVLRFGRADQTIVALVRLTSGR